MAPDWVRLRQAAYGLGGGFVGFNQPSHVNPVPGLAAIVALGYKELC